MDENYKIKTFVIDDEPLVLDDVVDQLNSSGFFEVIGAFHDLPTAFHAVDKLGAPDFLLTDIHMSGPQGLNATKLFEGICSYIVFMTAYEESAADAFRAYPKGCVFKPLKIAELVPFVKEFHLLRSHSQQSTGVLGGRIFVAARERGVLLPITVADITYAQTDGDFVKIFAPNLVGQPNMTMKSLTAMLVKRKEFIRISQQHLIAIDKIDHVNGHVVYLPSNSENAKDTDLVALPVTSFGKGAFEQFITDVKAGKYKLKDPPRDDKPNRDESKQME